MREPAGRLEEGIRVRVPWGRRFVEGTVVEVYGGADVAQVERPFVRVALELGGTGAHEEPHEDDDAVEVVALPADLLEPLRPAPIVAE